MDRARRPWDAVAPNVAVAAASRLEEGSVPDEARKYWAFQKPLKRPVPLTNRHPVDAFLEKAMQDRELKPAPRADAATLVRRAYLDLIGLPPTPAEVAAFVNDKSPDAWEKLIDRLLASPHYGERWGRHWLDVARYADSNGFEHDFDRPNAWRYRDYVIHSFNRGQAVQRRSCVEQIAGDELDSVTRDSLIATGFLRSYAKVGFREKDNPEFRYEYLDDMIATIGRGVLGLTVHCARCHNHKFDPIPQKDYYTLQASLFGYVEIDHPLRRRRSRDAYRDRSSPRSTARVERRSAEDPDASSSRIATAARGEIQEVPGERAGAIATPESEAHARRGAARGSGDPHRLGQQRRDRPHHDAGGLRAKEGSLTGRSQRSRRSGPSRSRWPWESPTAITASRPTVRAMNLLRAKASSSEASRRQLSCIPVRAATRRRRRIS